MSYMMIINKKRMKNPSLMHSKEVETRKQWQTERAIDRLEEELK